MISDGPTLTALVALLAWAPFSQRRYLPPLGVGLLIAAVFNLAPLATQSVAVDPGAATILEWLRQPWITVAANVGSGVLILWGMFGILFGGSHIDRLVRSLRHRGDYEGAGEIYLQHGNLAAALANFKKGGSWAKAAEVADRMKRYAEAGEYHRLAGGRSLGDAARAYRQADDSATAQQCDREHAEWLVANDRLSEAVTAWIRAGDPKQALRIANVALKQGRLIPADSAFRPVLRVAKQLGDHATEALLNEVLGDWTAVGYAWRAAGDHGQAANAFTKAGNLVEAARSADDAGHPHRSAKIRVRHLEKLYDQLQQAGQPGRVADPEIDRLTKLLQTETDDLVPVLSDLRMEDELIQVLTSSGRVEKAVNMLVASGRPAAAVDLARSAQRWTLAAPLLEDLSRWAEASDLWEFAGDLEAAARCAERAGEDVRALEIYRGLGRADKTALFMARLGYLQDALIELHRAGMLDEACQVLRRHPGPVPDIPDVILDMAAWAKKHGSLDDAIFCLQRAVVGVALQPGRLLPAVELARLLNEAGSPDKGLAIADRILEFDYSCEPAQQLRRELAASRRAPVRTPDGAEAAPESAAASAAHRYEILTELGRGGMGVVYKARDTRLDRDVAIKVLRETSPEIAARLEEEAKTAATLNHPGIVTVFDFEAGFGGYFIAMEFVPGEALDQVVRSARERVSANLLPILIRLADAVAYAHQHRVIHRDLKPANILLTPGFEVKVLDFGIAARLDLTSGRDLRVYGTPYYMAPEQIRGKRPTPATDVYSFGATAFHLATGRPPFNEGSIVDAHLRQPPPDILDLEPQLDPRLGELILKCLEKEPDARFRNGSELHEALARLSHIRV
ncbi:MAG: protein kinase [Thermoanaerobaculales bacterium]|jgi:tRNA A-37 threonylcarbamoyl transferase component Bud32|nr:protein kinase [Thermoanaerobaculales bacterium]